MAHDVFISHSSKDKLTADAICHSLEENGVRCWIAPRDVMIGANYGAEIIRGIRECKLLLLIFSANSNTSSAVGKEVETAFSNNKIIVPCRIEKVQISDGLSFYIAGNHWMDIYPDDKVFAGLVTNIRQLLNLPPKKVTVETKENVEIKEKRGLFGWFKKKQVDKQESEKPEAVKPEAVKPEIAKPETVKPEAVKPAIAKQETVKPVIAKPEAAKPIATTKNVNVSEKIAMEKREHIQQEIVTGESSAELVVINSDKSMPFDTLPQPVIPTFAGIPADATIFVPRGIAVIRSSNGIHYALANSIMFCWDAGQGSSIIETIDKEKLSVNFFKNIVFVCEEGSPTRVFHITDIEGDKYESEFKYFKSIRFIELPTLEQGKISTRQSFTIVFNWNQHSNIKLDYVLVEKYNDSPVIVPSIGFGFDYLSSGFMGIARRDSLRTPQFKDGLTIPSKKIRSFDITSKKLLGGYQWGISMDIVKRNGEKIPAYTSGDIQVSMLTANGMEYPNLQNIKRIVYLD